MQIRVWKLGSKDRPADEIDVEDFKSKLEKALQNPSFDGNADVIWHGEVGLIETISHSIGSCVTTSGGFAQSQYISGPNGISQISNNNQTGEPPKPKLRMVREKKDQA